MPTRLQDVDLSVFEELKRGDILFIDSTHVSKIDSDVNYLFFENFMGDSLKTKCHFVSKKWVEVSG